MPTDKQLREQFEADAKEALHWSTVSFDREELRPDEYAHRPMQYRWLGWQAAHRARDAEVQALREALEKIVELSRKPLTGGFEFALAFTAAEKVARAALAGGETGEAE